MTMRQSRFSWKAKAAYCYIMMLSIIKMASAFSTTTMLKSRPSHFFPSSLALKSAKTTEASSKNNNKQPISTSAVNPNSNPTKDIVLVSPTLINSAMDVLEEQHFHRPDTPIDAILRKYIKQSSTRELDLDSDEKDALREIVLGVARNQYKLDFCLKQIGLECTPENRVVAHVVAASNNVGSNNYQSAKVLEKKLMQSYKWLKKYKKVSSLSQEDENDNDEYATMDLQTRLECPDWAWPGLNEAFPTQQELELQLTSLLQPPPLDLRVNTLKCTTRDEMLQSLQSSGFPHAKSTPWSPLGIRLDRRVPLETIPGLLQGKLEPQDEGSQLVASLLNARPGETVADYCAGTGGKTLAIAAQMQNRGRLYSLDVDADRLERGRGRCAKAGVDNVQRQVVQADMTRKDKWCKRRNRTFDRVLVDAPCSGVGSWRRKPDARRTWGGGGGGGRPGTKEDKGTERLKELLPLQQHILRRAARLVKPGGRLVYVTCSLLPAENEHQVHEFLKSEEGEASGWRLDVPSPVEFAVPFEAGDGKFLRLTPARHGTDGFFAAVLRRERGGMD